MLSNRNWSGTWLVYRLMEYYTASENDDHEDNTAIWENVPNSFKWKMNFKRHTMTLTTKISLHVDTDSRSQERRAAIMQRNLIFPSNVIMADICGFCLASSHSLFFSNILLIFIWETTPPNLPAMRFRWIKSTLTSGLTNHSILSPETQLIQRRAHEINPPGQSDSVQGPLPTLLENWHSLSTAAKQGA